MKKDELIIKAKCPKHLYSLPISVHSEDKDGHGIRLESEVVIDPCLILTGEQLEWLKEKLTFSEHNESWYDKDIRTSIRRLIDLIL